MIFFASITIITLVIAALFHFYWAFGGTVGANKVIPTVDGKAMLNPSRYLTAFVGLVLLGFAWIAYLLNFKELTILSYAKEIVYAGWVLSAVFFIRSIGDFHFVGFFKKIRSTEFAKFDTKYFSPLTLFWSFVFAFSAYYS